MLSKAELVCVDPERIHEFWPFVEPLLRPAIERTGLSAFCDIEYDILSGDALVWLAWNGKDIEAAASTSLSETDSGKVCIVTACGGKALKRWIDLLRLIEAYAKREGCVFTRIYGRKGWQRVLDGYGVKHVILERRL